MCVPTELKLLPISILASFKFWAVSFWHFAQKKIVAYFKRDEKIAAYCPENRLFIIIFYYY